MMRTTRSQKMARAAFRVASGARVDGFAREFPALVHSCGLAQAFAFAKTKGQELYRQALTTVLKEADACAAATAEALEKLLFDMSVADYLRLSRDALAAAVWIKRYAEADAPATVGGTPHAQSNR